MSPSAVCQYAQSHKAATTKAVALKQAHRLVKADLDLLEKATKQEQRLERAAALCAKIATGDPAALQMTKQVRDTLKRTQFSDPLKLHLDCIKQLTDLIKVKQSLMESLFDVQHMAAFQQEVLEIIANTSPDLRKEVIRRLRENRSLAASLKVPNNRI